MLRRASLAISIIAVVLLTAVPASAWKFVSMADSRGDDNGVNTTVLTAIVNLVNAENVDFVLFQGDAVNGSSDDLVLSSQFDTWLGVMNNLNCPWYFVPGNHEIRSSGSEGVLRSKLNQPTNGPPGHEELVFSFEHQNAHFSCLNSNHLGEAHMVQTSWMITDLAATTKPHKFVMAHEPAYPAGPHIGSSLDVYPADRDAFWTAMENKGVGMYFTGHEHFYHRSTHGSIYQVINGTCGAPLYSAPGAISQYHFVIVDINNNTVQCTAKNDSGGVIDTWSYAIAAPATTISLMKAQPDGTPVNVAGKVVTAGNDQFTSTIYITEDDRSSGIKVYGATGTIRQGDKLDVSGTINSGSTERQITTPTVTLYTGPFPEPKALSLPTTYVGGAGLNEYTPGVAGGLGVHNTGLVVQIDRKSVV